MVCYRWSTSLNHVIVLDDDVQLLIEEIKENDIFALYVLIYLQGPQENIP